MKISSCKGYSNFLFIEEKKLVLCILVACVLLVILHETTVWLYYYSEFAIQRFQSVYLEKLQFNEVVDCV